MGGNISYDPSGTFSLHVNNGQPASQTFFRADTSGGAPPWTVQEQPTGGWALLALTCTHGASTLTISRAAGKATIDLAAGDTVTCTYTNAPAPTAGALIVRKITQGGVGTFPFTVTPTGGGSSVTRSVTTKTAGVAVASTPIKLSAGTYKVTEGKPKGGDTLWKQTSLVCNGKTSDGTVTISAAKGAVCTFTNTFTPLGRIEVREVTRGGVATAGYSIAPRLNPDGSRPLAVQYRKIARSTAQKQAGASAWTAHDRDCLRPLLDPPDPAALLGGGHLGARERLLRRKVCAVRAGDRAGADQHAAAAGDLHIHQRSHAQGSGRQSADADPSPDPDPDDAAAARHHRAARSRDPADVAARSDTRGARRSDGEPGRDQARRPHDREGRRRHQLHDHSPQHRQGRRPKRHDRRRSGRQTPTELSTPQPRKLRRSAAARLPARHDPLRTHRDRTRPPRGDQVGTVRNIAVTGSGASEARLRDNVAVAHAVVVSENPKVTGCSASVQAHTAC